MHYIVNVFVKPGDSLEEAMAPFNEEISRDEEYDEEGVGAWHGQRHWDWWVEGGRWNGYFGEEGNVTAAGKLASGEVKGRFDTPYAFVTLSRSENYPNVSRLWHAKEIYIPVGFYENQPLNWGEKKGKDNWRLNHFLDAPNYKKHYNDYLKSVPEDTLVYAVDVHQ